VLKFILKFSAIETAIFLIVFPFGYLPTCTLTDGENYLEETVIAVVNLP
jgi:hypothetical protein